MASTLVSTFHTNRSFKILKWLLILTIGVGVFGASFPGQQAGTREAPVSVPTAWASPGYIRWSGYVVTWIPYGYLTVSWPHYGWAFPGINATHRNIVIKPYSWTSDSAGWMNLHISKPSENSTGCLLIHDSRHPGISWRICGPDKWNVAGYTWSAMWAAAAGVAAWVMYNSWALILTFATL